MSKGIQYLCIDIGGSSIKYALMSSNADFIEKGKVQTPLDNIENFIETIGKIYDLYRDRIEGIAISMPGRLDTKKGYAFSGGALEYIRECKIVEILKERCNTQITIENDGKCAALAEVWKGSLSDCNDGIVIVLGTGVGGGIIKDRKVHKGKNFFAGEFSFIMTNAEDDEDFENVWASKNGSRALTESFAKIKHLNKKEVDGFTVFNQINSGDEDALNILDEFTNNIAIQIMNLQCVLDPEKIAIGGGISAQPILLEYIRKNLDKHYKRCDEILEFPRVEIVKCAYCNDSNLIGALYNFLTFDE